MKCNHCGASNAENKWHPAICADGNKRRTKRLCDPCDHMLNRFVLEFFNDKRIETKMSEYTSGNELWGKQSLGVEP